MCSDAAQQLAEQLQGVYLLDKKASETVRAGVLEALGLLVEVAPQVCSPTVQPRDVGKEMGSHDGEHHSPQYT